MVGASTDMVIHFWICSIAAPFEQVFHLLCFSTIVITLLWDLSALRASEWISVVKCQTDL